jgi:predicted porin
MEDFTEGKVSAMAANDSSDALSIETNRDFVTGRAEGGLAYISPSFNGFTFGVAGYAMNNTGETGATTTATLSGVTGTIDISNSGVTAISGAAGAATSIAISSAASSTISHTTTTSNNVTNQSANFDAIDMMVEYANGPLLVRASRQVTDKEAFNVSSNAKDEVVMNFGVNYTMGDTTLTGTYYEVDNGDGQDANDVDGYFVGVKHKMGANTLALGYMEEDSLVTTGTTAGDKATGQDESWLVSIDHALSKRTSITAAYKDHDDQTNASDLDQFAVGIKHVF